jgi:hypothetical protein
MKRRIESNYAYPTKYQGDLLALRPGINLVDEAVWANAKSRSSRLSAQLSVGKVKDLGRHVDWFLEHLNGPDADPNVNDLDADEIDVVAAQTKDRTVLERLLASAERGGIKQVLRAALGGRG